MKTAFFQQNAEENGVFSAVFIIDKIRYIEYY